jgi:hypothetical protein
MFRSVHGVVHQDVIKKLIVKGAFHDELSDWNKHNIIVLKLMPAARVE